MYENVRRFLLLTLLLLDETGEPPAAHDGPVNAAAIHAFCRKMFADSYTGIVRSDDPARYTVYRVRARAFDEALRSGFPGIEFDFRDAVLTERQVHAEASRIARDIDAWRERGIDIVSVAPGPTGAPGRRCRGKIMRAASRTRVWRTGSTPGRLRRERLVDRLEGSTCGSVEP